MKLVTYDRLYIDSLLRHRPHEKKLGECIQTLPWNAGPGDFAMHLAKSDCRYVLLGLPEDIGVRANGGRGGAYSAWQPVLSTLLNTQSNDFLKGTELLVLGHVDFSDVMQAVKEFNFHDAGDLIRARSMVNDIDHAVAPVIRQIVACGKEAIVIGGGHNNAYPCMKGAADALHNSGKIKNSSISVINCDAHSDFRPAEGRHSGNAFSYAFNDGILEKYFVIGLHESYSTGHVLSQLSRHSDKIGYVTFEDIYIRESVSFNDAVEQGIHFVNENYTGIELDMDAVQNIPSSAKTSSGISTTEARRFVHKTASSVNVAYLHIAEAAPVLSHIKTDLKTGKFVSYLISDFIKARNQFHKKNSTDETAH